MIAIDTNVLVRFLVNDDPAQFTKAKALLDANQIFVSTSVLLETEWVLRDSYSLPKARILSALSRVLDLEQITAENERATRNAIGWAGKGMDFADAIHLASAASCRAFATFDRRFSKAAAKLEALPVIAL